MVALGIVEGAEERGAFAEEDERAGDGVAMSRGQERRMTKARLLFLQRLGNHGDDTAVNSGEEWNGVERKGCSRGG